MDECKECQYCCPWIPVPGKDAYYKCPVWTKIVKERKVLKMVELTGRKLDRLPRFKDLGFNINKIRAEVDFIRTIHQNPNHLFYVHSNPGTGKTHCMLALTFEMLCKQIDCYYTTSKRMRDVWLCNDELFEDRQDCYEERDRFINSKMLIVDDFGHEGYSKQGHFQKNFEGILQSNGRKIILASNISYDDEDFPYKDEGWLMDRLNYSFRVGWHGKSYRKPLKEK